MKNDWLKEAENFHLKTRAFKLFEINYTKWDFTEPYCVCSYDQVPIALFPSHVKTIEEGVEQVCDCAITDKDTCRFCTLHLAAPMLLRPGKLNLTKANLVFQASALKDVKYWLHKDEVSKWNTRVIVSFQ